MKRCMYCGHENDDASENCVKCGNPLLATPTDNNGLPVEEAPESEVPADTVPGVDAGNSGAAAPASDDGYGYPEGEQYDQGYLQFGGQDYEYPGAEGAQAQYGGQAYGYDEDSQQYGEEAYQEKSRNTAKVLMKKARKRMHNPFLFLGLVFYTIHLVAAALNFVLGHAMENLSTSSTYIIKHISGQKDIVKLIETGVKYIQDFEKMYKPYVLGGALGTLFPVFLLILGLWIAFGSTSYKKEYVSTGGFTLARVAIVLKLIMICAAFLSAIVFLVVFVVSAGAASHMMSLIGGVIVLLVLVLFAVLVLLYYVQVMYGLKVVRTNVKDGTDIGKIPGFAIFVGFLGCAFVVLTMFPMAPDDYIGLAAKASYAAWLLFSSFWALIYRATVRTRQPR